MKPLDFTKPITTRDGRKVRILCTDGPDKTYPIIGIKEGDDCPVSWKVDGSACADQTNHRCDLINHPDKRKVEFWVNIYPDNTKNCVHYSRNGADTCSNHGRIACLHFTREYEEGEGL